MLIALCFRLFTAPENVLGCGVSESLDISQYASSYDRQMDLIYILLFLSRNVTCLFYSTSIVNWIDGLIPLRCSKKLTAGVAISQKWTDFE